MSSIFNVLDQCTGDQVTHKGSALAYFFDVQTSKMSAVQKIIL